jgi:hypothetical protein
MFVNAGWAESCPTPAVKHGRTLHGAAKRVFIKHCCEQMAQTKGGSIEEKKPLYLNVPGRFSTLIYRLHAPYRRGIIPT